MSRRTFSINWDHNSVIKFIHEYKKKEVLWNSGHRQYYNKIMKQDAWHDLGIIMKRPVEDLRKKMEYLLSALRREKGKIKKSKTMGQEGADYKYHSNWFAFPHMQYLLNRGRKLNATKDLDEYDDDEQIIDDESSKSSVTILEKEDIVNESPMSQTSDSRSQSPSSHASNSTRTPMREVSDSKSEVFRTVNQTPNFKCQASGSRQLESSGRSQVSGSRSRAFPTFENPIHIIPPSDPVFTEEIEPIRSSTEIASAINRYQAYTNYLASKFQTYSQKTFLAVEHQINYILYCADKGQYEIEGDCQSASTSTPEKSERKFSEFNI